MNRIATQLLLWLTLLGFSAHTLMAQPERLYGLAADGGAYNLGTLFRIKTDNTGFAPVHHFAGAITDGSNPSGPMAVYDGKLYGTASGGGATDQGVLFEFDPGTNNYAVKHSFSGFDGAGPKGGLVEADGSLWGMTELGGANGVGVLFQYYPTFDYFQVVYELDMSNDGANPTGSLIAVGHKLYGMTQSDGPGGYGTIFEYDLWTNTFTVLHSFSSFDGEMPRGGLVEKDGLLYGLCSGGGIYNYGLIFSYHIMYESYQDLHHFDGTDGGNPEGELLVSGDKLYGLTPLGGANSDGVLFEFDVSTYTYSVLHDFFAPLGASPKGTLLDVDGKLYGFTHDGGSSGEGVIFEFDPAFNAYAVLQDLGGPNGAHPGYGRFSPGPPCASFSLDAYALAPACQAPATGSIKVKQAYGGAPPYQYTINGGGSYQSSALFLNLPPANYTLEAKDANDCPSDPLGLTVDPVPADNTLPSLACRDVTLTLPPDCSPVVLTPGDVLDPAAPVFYAAGQNLGNQQAVGVALGDVDGDGDLDAFMINRSNEPHEVWFNDGAGLFVNSGQSLLVADGQSWARNIALGDVDGDGDLDAFVVNGEGDYPNHVWLNNGAGLFTDSGQRLGSANSQAIALGDVDSDGDLDACVGNDAGSSYANKIWLNDGSGHFTDSGQNLGTSRTRGLALGDLNGDGRPDLFEANFDGQPNRVYWNNGSGLFTDSGQLLGSANGSDVDLGDLDGDGDLDAFVTNFTQPNTVWLNNGAGLFSASGQSFGDGGQVAAALGDVDNDGDLDAFVAKTSPANTAAVWLNDGAALFNSSGQTLTNSFHFNVALGDVDGDGDLDAILAVLGNNTLWINALGQVTGDDCTAFGSLSLNLSQNIFAQNEAGANPVTLTVTDAASNDAVCAVTVTIIDCIIKFSGSIKWEHDNSGVKDATVNLTGSATGSALSDSNGDFLIPTTATTGSFTLKPVKNSNKLNGVTVGDVTAIQQHVTLINPITDPYKLVCADVNKSNSVTTFDASLIKQCLLGNPAANNIFNTSWRFVPTLHTMENPPWDFPEQRTYTGISNSQTDQDFIGMKLGDVTGDADPAMFGSGAPGLVLRTQDVPLRAGETLTAVVTADQADDLAAFQLALYFDPAKLQLAGVQPLDGLPLIADNFGLYRSDEGEIRVVWSQATGVSLGEAAGVFALPFEVLQSGGKLSDALQLQDDILPGRAYNSRLEASGVELIFTELTEVVDPAGVNGVLLLQNRPNPFSTETTIKFVLPGACEAQLRIFDATGRELWRVDRACPVGLNAEKVRLDRLTASGVLYYELTTPYGTLTKRMVRVE